MICARCQFETHRHVDLFWSCSACGVSLAEIVEDKIGRLETVEEEQQRAAAWRAAKNIRLPVDPDEGKEEKIDMVRIRSLKSFWNRVIGVSKR